MLEKTITMRVLEWFFSHPTTEVGLRELSRELDISLPSVSQAINELEEKNLVLIKTRRPMARITANKHTTFTRMKRLYNLERLYHSNLVDAIQDAHPTTQAVICFGSYSRGEDDETSDIDIAITTPEDGAFDVRPYEKDLKRTIHIVNYTKAPKLLRQNIQNGIILQGAL